MKKTIFNVTIKKEGCIVSLMKEVNKFPSRIRIDLEHGIVTVENLEDNMMDSIKGLIDRYFEISSIDINNTADKSTLKEISQCDVVTDESETDSKTETEAENPAKLENKPIEVGPQSEDDLIINKVEFENEYIGKLINNLIKTAYWTMYKMNISEKEIGYFILSSICEIHMRYNSNDCIEYSVGDIVDCNYGFHLSGEINGGHVNAIVCNVINDGRMAYLVPIIAEKENLTSLSYITFSVSEDIVCYSKLYGCTALLDKAKYVRAERFSSVVGKTTPEFFAKVLKQLSTTFDFTGNAVINNHDAKVNSDNDVVETETVLVKTTKSHTSGASALLNVIGDALEKLDRTKPVGEQVETFLTDIGMVTLGMTSAEKIVIQSFIIACNIKKINYENVISKLHDCFPKVKKTPIKTILRDNFKNWLDDMHPELVESCPQISFMILLKLFAKRFT